MRFSKLLRALAVLLPPASVALAEEPDFVVVLRECKTTVAYLASPSDLKVVAGEPATLACSRQSRAVSCVISFPGDAEGHKGNSVAYQVDADSPPFLLLNDANGAEVVWIHTTTRVAVLVSRVLSLEFGGSKVCHGIYATSFDLDASKK